MKESMKACYFAFLSTTRIADCKAASDKLKKLASSAYLARDMQAWHNITVAAPIEDEGAIADAEDIIRHYNAKFGHYYNK